jgi:hypothetical protein
LDVQLHIGESRADDLPIPGSALTGMLWLFAITTTLILAIAGFVGIVF